MPDVPLASLAPPSPLANQVAGFPGQARGMLADMFGITDAMRALRGEMTPEEAQNFALTSAAGLIPLPGAAEAAAPLTRLAEKMAPEAAEAAIPLASKAIRAYHGSPYDFDRFDLSKIGTGEGAQAYGHGLYMAENPEVAQSYKKAGQMFGNYKPDENYAGHLYEVNINADPEHFLDWDKPLSEQSEHVKNAIANVDKTLSPEAPDISQIKDPQIRSIVRSALKQNEGQAGGLELMIDNDSGLYNAAVSHAKRNGVDLEGNDMRASDYVYQQAKDYIDRLHASQNLMGDSLANVLGIRGADMMQAGPAAARLREAGIPGIRYLDQGSRQTEPRFTVFDRNGQTVARGLFDKDRAQQLAQENGGRFESTQPQQTHNYVVFSPDIINIIRKYGLAGVIGAGAAHFSLSPVDHDPFGGS